MGLKIDLLEQSFEIVALQADNLVSTFYDNTLVDYPNLKPLFQNSDMHNQKMMLKEALIMVIQNLRKPDDLSNALKGLGARHVKYGVLPEHYPFVGNGLLKTLAQYAGNAWNLEVEEAWKEAYLAIAEIMLEGANYTQDEISLQSKTASNNAD
jgi:nitric oxide dioxygenase